MSSFSHVHMHQLLCKNNFFCVFPKAFSVWEFLQFMCRNLREIRGVHTPRCGETRTLNTHRHARTRTHPCFIIARSHKNQTVCAPPRSFFFIWDLCQTLTWTLVRLKKKTIQINPDPTLGHMVCDLSFKDFITVRSEITVWSRLSKA